MGPGDLPPADLVGDEPLKAYRVGVEALARGAADDAITRTHETPFGAMPGAVLGGFTTVDILVHGWDLAKATGQDPTLDASLAEQMLGFAHQTLSDGRTRTAHRAGGRRGGRRRSDRSARRVLRPPPVNARRGAAGARGSAAPSHPGRGARRRVARRRDRRALRDHPPGGVPAPARAEGGRGAGRAAGGHPSPLRHPPGGHRVGAHLFDDLWPSSLARLKETVERDRRAGRPTGP